MSRRSETITPIPYGVTFLYDPTMIIDVPADTGAASVLATSDCVSLWTVHGDDGPTTLVITDRYDDQDCKLVFQGCLAAKGRKLAFNTSSCEPIITMDLMAEIASVSIYANDPSEPSKLVCVAAPLAT